MGLTRDDVARAANELLEAGIPVTHLNVRGKLGTGSFVTIGKYLKAWKADLESAGQEGLAKEERGGGSDDVPEFFRALGARVGREAWGTARSEIDSQLQVIRSAAEQEIAVARQEVDAAGSAVDELQVTLEKREAEISSLKEEVLRLRELSARAEGERARLDETVQEQGKTIQGLQGELSDVRQKLAKSDSSLEGAKVRIATYEKSVEQLQREKGVLDKELERERTKYDSAVSDLQHAGEEIARLRERLSSVEPQAAEKKQVAGELVRVQSHLDVSKELHRVCKEDLDRERALREKLEERIEALHKELRQEATALAALKERVAPEDAKKGKK